MLSVVCNGLRQVCKTVVINRATCNSLDTELATSYEVRVGRNIQPHFPFAIDYERSVDQAFISPIAHFSNNNARDTLCFGRDNQWKHHVSIEPSVDIESEQQRTYKTSRNTKKECAACGNLVRVIVLGQLCHRESVSAPFPSHDFALTPTLSLRERGRTRKCHGLTPLPAGEGQGVRASRNPFITPAPAPARATGCRNHPQFSAGLRSPTRRSEAVDRDCAVRPSRTCPRRA